MSKDREPDFSSQVVFISYHDNLAIDEAAVTSLTSLEDADLKAWLKERATVAGQRFTVHFDGCAPEVQAATPPPSPPREAERLLYYVLPRERRENIIGCLEEDYYTKWLPKFGPDEARRMYWSDAIRSIVPMLWTGVRRSAIITAIVGAADWLRDRLG